LIQRKLMCIIYHIKLVVILLQVESFKQVQTFRLP